MAKCDEDAGILDVWGSEHEQVVRIKLPHRRYMDEFVGLDCAADLLALKVFPNSKEITESMAAYRAVQKHLRRDFKPTDPEVRLIAVGDGNTPRTAALFAFRTAWNCYSIDPRMKSESWPGIRRLAALGLRIEECRELLVASPDKLVIVAVHSHADLDAALAVLPGVRRALVALPCCVPQSVSVRTADGRTVLAQPDVEYQDWGIWSPERTVKVWRSI